MNPKAPEFVAASKAEEATTFTMAEEADTAAPADNEATGPAVAATPSDNDAAQQASHTAEGMAEYLNVIEQVDTVGEIAANLVTYRHPFQISHNEMARFYGGLETHIMPFLGKYGYEELKKIVNASYNEFVDEVTHVINHPHESKKVLSQKYLEFVNVTNRVLTNIMKDFGGDVDGGEASASATGAHDTGSGLQEAAPTSHSESEEEVRGVVVEEGDVDEGRKKENMKVIVLDMAKLALNPTPANNKSTN
ncbi:hypothetical protein TWF481_011714 [Arthrobotrys musiformis]|uniref:Uncharacterized protein n=1 Tax=Arthrobotrys musiformis TaxID=47236 RepID=A0AAV9W187_9PEZI